MLDVKGAPLVFEVNSSPSIKEAEAACGVDAADRIVGARRGARRGPRGAPARRGAAPRRRRAAAARRVNAWRAPAPSVIWTPSGRPRQEPA